MSFWLLKSEPASFAYADLVAAKRTGWDGVRNYQARIFLQQMRVGDEAIFYHSSANPPGAAGVCRIVRAAEPDPTQFDPQSHYFDPIATRDEPRWLWVTVAPVRELHFVPLTRLREIPELAGSRLLARGNRLSVFPLTAEEFDAIARAGER
jgi:predicted RNA-binding protein with PUA-like domain